MAKLKAMPTTPDNNMISAAYMLIETMPKGTEARHKKIVAEVWRTMAEFAPGAKSSGLTERMRICHEIIADYINENGRAPSYDEIGAQMGKQRHDVLQIVHSLRRRGFITFRDGFRRSIRVLIQPGENKPSTKS